MSAVKNSDGNVTHYKGYTADFIYYIAEHFEWRYEVLLYKLLFKSDKN